MKLWISNAEQFCIEQGRSANRAPKNFTAMANARFAFGDGQQPLTCSKRRVRVRPDKTAGPSDRARKPQRPAIEDKKSRIQTAPSFYIRRKSQPFICMTARQ